MMTTAASTRSLTPRPASMPLPQPLRYKASRMSRSPCPVMPSGSGLPSSPLLETLWWWALSMPALSDEHMLTKTTRTLTHPAFSQSPDPRRRLCRQSLALCVSCCLSFYPSHFLAGKGRDGPEGVKVAILDSDIYTAILLR